MRGSRRKEPTSPRAQRQALTTITMAPRPLARKVSLWRFKSKGCGLRVSVSAFGFWVLGFGLITVLGSRWLGLPKVVTSGPSTVMAQTSLNPDAEADKADAEADKADAEADKADAEADKADKADRGTASEAMPPERNLLDGCC